GARRGRLHPRARRRKRLHPEPLPGGASPDAPATMDVRAALRVFDDALIRVQPSAGDRRGERVGAPTVRPELTHASAGVREETPDAAAAASVPVLKDEDVAPAVARHVARVVEAKAVVFSERSQQKDSSPGASARVAPPELDGRLVI